MDKEKLVFEMFKMTTPVSTGAVKRKCLKLGANYKNVTNMLLEYHTSHYGGYFTTQPNSHKNGQCEGRFIIKRGFNADINRGYDTATQRHFNKIAKEYTEYDC